MSDRLASLLRAVARRLRMSWAVSTWAVVAPVAALVALLVVLLGWLRPWVWPEPVALVVVVVALLGVVVGALVLRVSDPMAARAADRGLGTHDAFSSALQFAGHDTFGDRISERAERFVSADNESVGSLARRAVEVKPRWPRFALAGLLGIGALVLALVGNPQDDARAEAAASADLLEAEAERLEELAESIEALPEVSEAEEALASELARLAEELRSAESLEAGAELLDDAASLFRPDSAQQLSAKAAAQGLNRSLEAQPLANTPGTAAEQLAALADSLDGLTEEELDALADRLDALAETQGAGNPDAAAALSDAAAALRSGNTAGAQAALGEASGAQAAGEGAVREGEAGSAAASAANAGSERLRNGEGQGEGQGEGDGEGEGQGEGQGQGQGQGGQGQGGQGQGGQGGGSPSGDVTGSNGGTGSGRGGQGNAVGGNDSTVAGDELEVPELFSPGGETDELFANTLNNDGDSETVGLGQGATNAGGSRVPLSDALPDFESQTIDALDDATIPPSTRALVQRYFDSLAGLSGDR